MTKENSYNADYGGLKVNHAGDWSKEKYHDHNKVHNTKPPKEIQRTLPVIKRERNQLDRPQPTTSIVDLGTNTKTVVESPIDKANKQDLQNRGIK